MIHAGNSKRNDNSILYQGSAETTNHGDTKRHSVFNGWFLKHCST